MAAVMFNGLLWDKQWKSVRPVVFMGDLSPVDPTKPPDPPLGIWGGGNVPGITPPIGNLPGYPNWPTFPDSPIPPKPEEPPPDPSIVKPPPPEGGWGWSPEYGWGYFPGSGEAGPKK